MKYVMAVLSTMLLGASAFAGDGSLPENPAPGACYVHKFYPPTYAAGEVSVLVKAAYKTFEITPAVFETVHVKVLDVDAYDTFSITPPVFKPGTVQVEVKSGDPIWSVTCCSKKDHDWDKWDKWDKSEKAKWEKWAKDKWGKDKSKWDKDEYDKWSHGNHDHDHDRKNSPCEEACFKPQRPEVKNIPIETLVTDGSYIKTLMPPHYITIPVKKLKTPPSIKVVTIPAVYIKVPTIKLVSPGYMKWEEGTCAKYVCDPKKLQSSLKNKGYYDGSINGKLDTATMTAVNKFRADNGIGIHKDMDAQTAKALGIES